MILLLVFDKSVLAGLGFRVLRVCYRPRERVENEKCRFRWTQTLRSLAWSKIRLPPA